jgi:long-chain fatty acid transport protein
MQPRFPRSQPRALVGATVALVVPVALFAGGMALTMQNGAHLGQAFSAGASAEDASTIYYNPAGLMELERSETLLSLSYI